MKPRPPTLAVAPLGLGTGGGRRASEVLRRLEVTISRRLDGLLQGDHLGLLPGPGSEPGDARSYVVGDDVRRMDWNVTARTGEAHVRLSIADRELETWVLVDRSASLAWGTAAQEKRELALAAVAAIGSLTARLGNRLGAVVVAGPVVRRVPARSGRTNLLALLDTVAGTADPDGSGATDLAAAIGEVGRLARRRGLVVVVSDLLADPAWISAMRVLAARHDVVVIEVVDPRELELPDVGLMAIVDPETGRRLEVQTSDAALRRRYAEAAAAQRADNARALRTAGADHLVVRTDRDWLLDLVAFLVRRRRLRPAPRPAAAR